MTQIPVSELEFKLARRAIKACFLGRGHVTKHAARESSEKRISKFCSGRDLFGLTSS